MKKIICLVLIFTMMFTACSKWKVEIVDPTEPSESEAEDVSKNQDDFHERMEYEDFYATIVETKGGILPELKNSIANFLFENGDNLKSEYGIETFDVPEISTADDFSIRKTYEQEGKVTYYAAVPVKNNREIRAEIIETPKNEEKIWKLGEVKIAWLYVTEEFYDWELSDIPTPKNYPTVIQIGTWETDRTDLFGQENPFEQKYGSFDHLECRNWTNFDEYKEASFAVPVADSPDAERAYGQINMLLPERIFFEGSSIICWDGNFGEDKDFGGPNTLKIGELRFFEEWHEPDETELSGKTESEEIGLDKIKITEKYVRTFGDIYSSGKVELVDYHVNLGRGCGVSVYFYISESLTEKDIEIYDRIVESMVFVDMR